MKLKFCKTRSHWKHGFILTLIVASLALAQTAWTGTRLIATPGIDWAMALTTGGNHDLALVGFTTGSLESQVALGGRDAFVTVYDSSGQQRWVHQFGGKNNDNAFDIKLDSAGNYFVCGDTNYIYDRTDGG